MNPTKPITGSLFIPLNPAQNPTFAQLLSPRPSLFRSVLHQGELAVMYLVARIPPSTVPASFTGQTLLDSTDLRPSLDYPQVKDKPESTEPWKEPATNHVMCEERPKGLELAEGVERLKFADKLSSVRAAYWVKEQSAFVFQLEVPIKVDPFFLSKGNITISFELTVVERLNFAILSQTDSEGKLLENPEGERKVPSLSGEELRLPGGRWNENRLCSGRIDKLVTVIQPLSFSSEELLRDGQGQALVSISVRNETEAVDYFDRDLVDSLPPGKAASALRGMSIMIEDVQCDVKKSVIHGLDDEFNKVDLMRLLTSKGEKLFDCELVDGGNGMPTELKPGEWLNLVVRIEKKGWALMKE